MNPTSQQPPLDQALSADDSSIRMRAAMAAGSNPDPASLDVLIERCAVEPDFFVRDMLTWALLNLPPDLTLPRLRRELHSERTQARGQALHTLSKIGDDSAWPWITAELLHDPDDDVARAAWRAAVALVPENEREGLAGELVGQLGRGDHAVQLSLSQALVALGDVVEPALNTAASGPDPEVAAHARSTQRLLRDPDAASEAAVSEAKRVHLLGPL